MDALEFLKEQKRMCNSYINSYNGCCDCPLVESHCVNCFVSNTTPDEDLKKMITIVEQWSKDHPRKTRQSVFLEQWPEAGIDNCGVLKVCPAPISVSHRNIYGKCAHTGVKCSDCRREFWMKEVDE